jgi:hypothetical protein
MRIVTTRVHGIVDYLSAAVLIAAPYLLGFATGGVEQWLPMGLGSFVLLYSLATRYEYGAAGLISIPAHLGLDALVGVILIASPWLFGFAHLVFWPHVIVGGLSLLMSLVTRTRREEPIRLY